MNDFSFFKGNPIIKKRSDSLTRFLDERAFIVGKENGNPIRLNPVGTQIWAWLEIPRRISDLTAFICDRYEIEPKEAARDLEAFLGELIQKQLIEFES
jgi:hypothetical protein